MIPTRAIKEREFPHNIQSIVDKHQVTASHHCSTASGDLPQKSCSSHEGRLSSFCPLEIVGVTNLFSSRICCKSFHCQMEQRRVQSLKIPSENILAQVDLFRGLAKSASVKWPQPIDKIRMSCKLISKCYPRSNENGNRNAS